MLQLLKKMMKMNYKQAIIVRTDLGMGKGKIVAQSIHAALQAFREASDEAVSKWELSGEEKIALKVRSEKELVELFEKARKAKLPCSLIRDAGHTQIPSGTITAVAIGPCEESKLDEITGKLKLL